jgi:O-acetyl-ADP-ribose deacetylase (regulator of RNase III)
MEVEYKTGDLFDYESSGPILGHGVNCEGYMGKGIALEFRKRFPQMYSWYKAQCLAGNLEPGHFYEYTRYSDGYLEENYYTIFNLATQDRSGAHAKLDYIYKSLNSALVYCHHTGYQQLSIPRIGCGIGGLDWREVKPVIERVAEIVPDVQLSVWTLEAQKTTYYKVTQTPTNV